MALSTVSSLGALVSRSFGLSLKKNWPHAILTALGWEFGRPYHLSELNDLARRNSGILEDEVSKDKVRGQEKVGRLLSEYDLLCLIERDLILAAVDPQVCKRSLFSMI